MRIRINTSVSFRWKLLVEGEEVDLSTKDISVEIATPAHTKDKVEIVADGSYVSFGYKPKQVGQYIISAFLNRYGENESALDVKAFEAVRYSWDAASSYVGSLDATTVELDGSLSNTIDISQYYTKSQVDAITASIAQSSNPDYSNTYAGINHTHAQYLTSTPDYSNTYAGINHTHNQYLTAHQALKTINGQSITGSGNIAISASTPDYSSTYASLNHTHAQYLTSTPDYSSTYAGINHTHAQYLTASSLNGYLKSTDDIQSSRVSFSYEGFEGVDDVDGALKTISGWIDNIDLALEGKAASDHTHNQYLTSTPDYSSTYAPLIHTHSQYLTASSLNGYMKSADVWTGTQAQWDALTTEQQASYKIALVTE